MNQFNQDRDVIGECTDAILKAMQMVFESHGVRYTPDQSKETIRQWITMVADYHVAKARPATGLPWNPMDTAPKGRGFGSPILLKKGHERILARWESGSWIAWGTGCGCGVNHDFEVENPEGWLPADHEGEPATGLPFTEVQRELMRDALNNYVLDRITKGLGGSCAVANAKDLINQLQ